MPLQLQFDSIGILPSYVWPRYVYDSSSGRVFLGSADHNLGNSWVGQWDPPTQTETWFPIAIGSQSNIHCTPAVLVLDDGTLATATQIHYPGASIQYRRSSSAGDVSAWNTAVSITDGDSGLTAYYLPKLGQLSGDSNNLYLWYVPEFTTARQLFYRKSTDRGATWGTRVQVLIPPTGGGNGTDYNVFCNGVDTFDILWSSTKVAANVTNKIYHIRAKVVAGSMKYYDSAGTEITSHMPMDDTAWATYATTVYDGSGNVSGNRPGHFVENSGNFVCTIASFDASDASQIYFRRPRWNGSSWVNQSVTIAAVGAQLGNTATAHAGCEINPSNINEVTLAHKVSSHFEIQKYTTSDSGSTWSKSADITTGSSVDNFFPGYVQGANSPIQLIFTAGSYTDTATYSSVVLHAFTSAGSEVLPSIVAKDTLKDVAATNLISHYADYGEKWTAIAQNAVYSINATGWLYCSASGGTTSWYTLPAATPKNANYKVSWQFKAASVNSDIMGFTIRQPDTSTQTGYWIGFYANAGSSQIKLYSVASGTFVQLGSTYNGPTLNPGDTHTITAQAINDVNGHPVITVTLDGVAVITQTDSGNVATSGNVVGIRSNSATGSSSTGLQMGSMVVTEYVAPAAGGLLSGLSGISGLSGEGN